MRGWAGLVAAALAGAAAAQSTPGDRLAGDLAPTHDPVIAREGDAYYVFATGDPIRVRTSTDLISWKDAGRLAVSLPGWARNAVPGARGMWAPDISRVNGRWRLYYSVSTFGSNRSAIGLFTSPTLDPKAPGYGWRDEGLVVRSTKQDDYNAIDPNFIVDREGGHWLAFGSFWSGLKLIRLDPRTGKPLDPAAAPVPIARRPTPPGAIEAPFIVEHGGWYHLLASFDLCCRKAESSYYTVVGRSRAITGPYLDREGRPMLEGGGTVLLRAGPSDRFRGPGHAGWLRDCDGRDYLVHHAYERDRDGTPTLRIAPIRWDRDGWMELRNR